MPEVASAQAAKDMAALRDEFEGLSDAYLSREADRFNDIEREALSAARRVRSELMRRALVSFKEAE
jgi:hypothetical protein